ncbi:type II and III secretion system protein family protein [Castellaniella sp.]|uniref:type II and III secretion system protein family protein n=1 Tax=Castellaniella sp. TaxID=1955812 RepID=UPI002AFE90BA|nr:type II and III secretion system protein family protein [Castellaniella sp.]
MVCINSPIQSGRPIRAGLLLCLALLGVSTAAQALNLAVGAGDVLTMKDARTVFVADPNIADVQVPPAQSGSNLSVLVVGKRAGTTTLYALDADGKRILRESIVVRHNLTELQQILTQRFPALRLSLESAPGSLMVSGSAPSAEVTEAIARTIQPYLGEKDQLINRIHVDSPTQVYLRVRVTEMSKAITQKLGINWNVVATPGQFVTGLISGRSFVDSAGGYIGAGEGYSFLGGYSKSGAPAQAMIDVLDRENLLTVLAEPNLTAVSGQTASFLAGGEFPIPVKQDKDTMSIEFKPFGVSLDFTPTVLSDDRISLKVRPEISELDPSASILVDGLAIPGIRVRRAETTVEMASGQSFAIGGLLQNNISDLVDKIPGLGSIPVLGKLFSSTNYKNHKSELVIIVTPYLVRPTSPDQLTNPVASMRASSDIEFLLSQRMGYDPLQSTVPRLSGAAGFVY